MSLSKKVVSSKGQLWIIVSAERGRSKTCESKAVRYAGVSAQSRDWTAVDWAALAVGSVPLLYSQRAGAVDISSVGPLI